MSALGNRYSCIQCEAKFYDLGKSQAICPACGTDQAAPEEKVSEPVAVAVSSAGKAKKATTPDDGSAKQE